MSFTITFSQPIAGPTFTACVPSCTFTTTDGGTTFTLTTGSPTTLSGFPNKTLINSVSNIPTSVTTIGSYAFQSCPITSIVLPNTLTTIEQGAFDGTNITTITLPASVTTIQMYAFDKIANITVNPSNNNFSSIDGNLYNKTGTILIRYAVGKTNTTFDIPNGVTTIQNNAFLTGLSNETRSLTTVTFPTTITTFSNSAFYQCSLTSITIPNTVTSFGFGVFNSSSSLTSATLPNNLTRIPNSMFVNCSALQSITIPSSVTIIGSSAFQNCSALQSITIPNSVTTIESFAFNNCTSPSLTSVTIPGSVRTLELGAFQGCNKLTTITLEAGVQSIGLYLFSACTSLKQITIPSTVTSIGSNAFEYCTSLKQITIPSSVTSIGSSAFQNCTSLKEITIPSTVTSIGSNVFLNVPFPINVYTDILDNSNYVYTYFTNPTNYTSGQVTVSFPPLPIIPCFNKDTKILTTNGYVPIQDLRKGDLVKTINHGFVPINMIGCKTITNSKDEIPPNKLFVCSNENYPEITEDLYITGLHSILVDELTQEEESNLFELFGKMFVTDGKYRLPVFMDKRANLYEESGEYTIYHIALDHDHELMNYGIYANGLLVETCCIKYLKEHSNMDLIE